MRQERGNKEVQRFWVWSWKLREARRACPEGEVSPEVEECLVELDALAHHAHNGAVKARCYALLGRPDTVAEDASA